MRVGVECGNLNQVLEIYCKPVKLNSLGFVALVVLLRILLELLVAIDQATIRQGTANHNSNDKGESSHNDYNEWLYEYCGNMVVNHCQMR